MWLVATTLDSGDGMGWGSTDVANKETANPKLWGKCFQ